MCELGGGATTLACEGPTSERLVTWTNGFQQRRSENSNPRRTRPRALSAMTDRSRDQRPTIGAVVFGANVARRPTVNTCAPIRLIWFADSLGKEPLAVNQILLVR